MGNVRDLRDQSMFAQRSLGDAQGIDLRIEVYLLRIKTSSVCLCIMCRIAARGTICMYVCMYAS